jgi:phage terminase large subunit GpA-like protein
MGSLTEPNVRRIVVKSAAQVSKSECLLNVIGRFAQLEPCPILLIQPTLSDAEDFSKLRLSKMIADTKCLTPLFYDKLRTRDHNQTILSKFFKGGRVLLVGSNSPSGLASRPIKILLCDEVDRYPNDTGEGDAVDLAAKRTSNYFDARIGLFSTPTTLGASRIDVEYELGTQEEWRHCCPNCHEWRCLSHIDMVTDHTINKDSNGNRTVVVRAVKWRCPDCGMEFTEQDMRRAAQAYFAQNPDALSNGVRSFFYE